MKDAYYFPHFCNARQDRKIKRLRKELGLEGYGIYFMLLETLREQAEFKFPMEDIDLLADEFGTSEQKLRTVICNYQLFQVDNQENFFSLNFIKYLTPYLESRQKKKIAGIKGNLVKYGYATKEQLKNLSDLEIIEFNDNKETLLPMRSQCESGTSRDASQIKEKEIKEKESKVNEIKLNKIKENNRLSPNFYLTIFNHYVSKDNLVKHKRLTESMKKSIDKGVKEFKLDKEECLRIVDRHSMKLEEKTDYPIKRRTLSELFGQRKYRSEEWILSDYLDEVWIEVVKKDKLSKAQRWARGDIEDEKEMRTVND